MNSFPCSGCGLCCTRINIIGEAYGKEVFPYGWDETGRCEKLTDDNRCSIYDSRPLICSVDGMYDAEYHKEMTRAEFYRMNAEICNEWMDENNLPIKLRINYGLSEKTGTEIHREITEEDIPGDNGEAHDHSRADAQDQA
jgi:Fe-S-cluster containining protein